MLDLQDEVAEVYLYPGQAHLARKPAIIRTILGSCVGVTFWSSRLGVGALSHSQLPRCPSNANLKRAVGHRYVDYTIRDLARQFDKLGAVRAEMQVKLFGGADVLVVQNGGRPTVGRLNYEVAIEVLREEGFEVNAQSIGGTSGLHICFDTRTGEVKLRRLS